jgi:hypothetical protein
MTIEHRSPYGHQLHERLHHVKTMRDDLRLKIDLFESDARVELTELESRIEGVERELTSATAETAGAVAKALDRLSAAFHQFQKKATKKEGSTRLS